MTNTVSRYLPRLYVSFKATNLCNLRCDYCYVFNGQKQVDTSKPAIIREDVVEKSCQRIVEFYSDDRIIDPIIQITGGEALLIGKGGISNIVQTLRDGCSKNRNSRLEFILQTNGTLLDQSWIDLFDKLDVSVGISVDSPPIVHDRHRLYLNGRGCYSDTLKGARLLSHTQSGKRIFRWVLSRIDIESDPLEAYYHFLELDLATIEFLFPVCNYIEYPPGKTGENQTNYADWLIPVFDEWFNHGRGRIYLQPFEAMIKALQENRCFLDFIITGGPTQGISVQTDGCFTSDVDFMIPQKPSNGWNVFQHRIADIFDPKLYRTSSVGHMQLPQSCRVCTCLNACGGDYREHRRDLNNDFEKPSVYCNDLFKLFAYIEARI